jgi:poly-beta-1,6-N-acetyl-D-glucosamine biosynthesis protein PgaD
VKQKVFVVPQQDATPLTVIPGSGMAAASNEDVPLRDRPPVVEAPGLFINFSRSGILITGTLLAAITTWCMIRVFLFFAWMLGLRAFEHHFTALGGMAGVTKSISGFVIAVCFLFFGLCCWALYNWFRFHGPDRRRAPRPVNDRIVAEHYGLPAYRVWRWQYAKRIIAHHDDRGIVRGAESEYGTWIRDKEEDYPVIKPNSFDILYLSARSRTWRTEAKKQKPIS